jgi:hypothetical protein
LRLTFYLTLLPFWLTAQLSVSPNYQSAVVKPGYKLIFQDEFDADTLNLRNWDRSSSNLPDDTPCGFYGFDNMLDMVRVENGKCIIRAEKATPRNSNCPLQPDCDRGVSGDIKTFTWRDSARIKPDAPGHFFENYTIPVGSYVEARLKTANPECNVGSSFWIYGFDQEIDVFEVSHDTAFAFTCGYFSGRLVKGKYLGPYQRSRNFWQRATLQNGKFPKITESKISFDDKFKMHEQFAVYAVHYTTDSIHFFLNDVRYFSYSLASYKRQQNTRLTPMAPKNIRFSAGQLTGGGHVPCSVPCTSTQMEIDYVRVYLPENERFIKWIDELKSVKQGQAGVIKATHNPAVQYQFTSDAWQIETEWPGAPDAYKLITPKPGLAAGVYPVKLVCTLPDGSKEALVRDIELVAE